MRNFVLPAALIAAVLSSAVSGAMLLKAIQQRAHDRLHAHLEECGYRPHPMADVSWELVARGQIPACSAAVFSGLLVAPQPEGLDACMTEAYPEPVCNRGRN